MLKRKFTFSIALLLALLILGGCRSGDIMSSQMNTSSVESSSVKSSPSSSASSSSGTHTASGEPSQDVAPPPFPDIPDFEGVGMVQNAPYSRDLVWLSESSFLVGKRISYGGGTSVDHLFKYGLDTPNGVFIDEFKWIEKMVVSNSGNYAVVTSDYSVVIYKNDRVYKELALGSTALYAAVSPNLQYVLFADEEGRYFMENVETEEVVQIPGNWLIERGAEYEGDDDYVDIIPYRAWWTPDSTTVIFDDGGTINSGEDEYTKIFLYDIAIGTMRTVQTEWFTDIGVSRDSQYLWLLNHRKVIQLDVLTGDSVDYWNDCLHEVFPLDDISPDFPTFYYGYGDATVDSPIDSAERGIVHGIRLEEDGDFPKFYDFNYREEYDFGRWIFWFSPSGDELLLWRDEIYYIMQRVVDE